jgi:superfamily II DNA or RNA helicase
MEQLGKTGIAPSTQADGFRAVPWRLSYDTGAPGPDGAPVDILRDFYLPALSRAVAYDRVAGYFRSTSLAAAAQGFEALARHQGQIRLVVGADLDAADVSAVLKGEEARRDAALLAALGMPEDWPAEVRDGVALLAWMVARRRLDMKVAFRVHARSGRPLTIASVADGYVHMKFAVLRDGQGDRLYISGSLNESRTALDRNAENIDVHCSWRGEDPAARVADAENRFAFLWGDENPATRVIPLPEAVRQRLIEFAPLALRRRADAPDRGVELGEGPSLSPLEQLRFALLRDGPSLPNGRAVGIATAPIEPWPHQAVVVRRLIECFPFSWLLCDEVGLGKTIEAGLALRSLHLSGIARRILIAAPASLTRQWQREMASKFLLPFGRARSGSPLRHEYLLPAETDRPAASLCEPDLVIVSTGLLVRQDRREELRRMRGFDVILLDEAHYARRRNPQGGTRADPQYGHLYRLLADPLRDKARALLLATATPMQLDPIEAIDLLSLTRRAGPFLEDPSLLLAYYEALGDLVKDRDILLVEWEFLRQALRLVWDQDPLLWDWLEASVIDGRVRLAVRQWLDEERIPRGLDRRYMRRLIFAAAPLSRVMMRHTRPLLEIYRRHGRLGANLAERKILPIPRIVFTEQEKAAYAALDQYCKGLAERLGTRSNSARAQSLGFYLSFLRLRFASSLYAVRETLRRRRERVEATRHAIAQPEGGDEGERQDQIAGDDEGDETAVQELLRDRTPEDLAWEFGELGRLLEQFDALTATPSKMQHLLSVLQGRRAPGNRVKQVVLFTRFADTLDDIVRRLHTIHPGLRIGTYSGQGGHYVDPAAHDWTGIERDEIRHRFMRGEIDILVCTDAAAEGLNLQSADLLVNYDLPWNPMKVEQRIGRIDRIGQQHAKICVLNLCTVGSAEEIVYGRLLERLSRAGLIVGTQQLSLLPVTEHEFEDLAAGRLSETELMERAEKRAREAQDHQRSMEISPEDLYEIYERQAAQGAETPAPVTLDDIWAVLSGSAYLRSLDCRVLDDEGMQAIELNRIPGVPDGTILSVSRETYERGLPQSTGPIRFASYGEPAFDAVLGLTAASDLPPGIRRVAVPIPGAAAGELIGYLVMHRDKGGAAPHAVFSMSGLDGLEIDPQTPVPASAVDRLRVELAARAREEFRLLAAAERIEKANEAAGRAQARLTRLVARYFILSAQRTHRSETSFARQLAILDEIAKERVELRLPGLPVDQLCTLSGVPFSIRPPAAGNEMHFDAPRPLLKAAVDLAAREADALHRRRAEVTTEQVLRRL